jgi:hypothetical protein
LLHLKSELSVTISELLERQIIESHNAQIEHRKKAKEKCLINNDLSFESDDNFAVIVGYTSGGAPYGLTHEEFEKIEIESTGMEKDNMIYSFNLSSKEERNTYCER